MSNITIDEQISCVERERAFRRRLYPRWVRDGKLTQALADRETLVLAAVAATLLRVQLRQDHLVPGIAEVRAAAQKRVLDLVLPHMHSSKLMAVEKKLAEQNAGLAYCQLCERDQPAIDDGETCAVCKLVL